MTIVDQPTQHRSVVLTTAATGAAVELAVSLVYQLIRIGFHVASSHTLPAGGAAPPTADSPDRVFGIYVIGGLLSLAPSMLAGGVFGALLGAVMNATKSRQSILGSWLTGSVLAWVAVAIVNTMVLHRTRRQPLSFTEWAPTLGYPSILFVLVFGGLAVWVHLSSAEGRAKQGFLNE